jgi:hypothetical protein
LERLCLDRRRLLFFLSWLLRFLVDLIHGARGFSLGHGLLFLELLLLLGHLWLLLLLVVTHI